MVNAPTAVLVLFCCRFATSIVEECVRRAGKPTPAVVYNVLYDTARSAIDSIYRYLFRYLDTSME